MTYVSPVKSKEDLKQRLLEGKPIDVVAEIALRPFVADVETGGFVWPRSGPVECPDWDPTPKCGHGLHGVLWGEGAGNLLSWAEDAQWIVVDVLVPADVETEVRP